MDKTRQERPNEGPFLNVNKKLYRQSLNKTFSTHVEKSMVFKSFKNKKCIIPRSKYISGKPPRGFKDLLFPKSQWFQNPKTGKHIDKIFGIQSETSLLINYRKISSLSTEKWGESLSPKQLPSTTKLLTVNTRDEA